MIMAVEILRLRDTIIYFADSEINKEKEDEGNVFASGIIIYYFRRLHEIGIFQVKKFWDTFF